MQYKPTRSLCATVAIAATLALGSTSTFAQDAAPTISVPPAAPAPVMAAPPAAAPTIVVPPVTVQPTAPQPVAEAAPQPAARPAPRAQAPKQAAAPKSTPAPRAATPVAAAPVASAPVETVPAAPVVPAETVAQTPLNNAVPAPVAEPTPAAQADNGLSGEEIGFLALLAAIGAGGIAFLMMGKRRRRLAAESEAYEADYAADPVPVAEPTVSLAPPVAVAAAGVRTQPVYDVSDHPSHTAQVPSFAMPMGAVPTGDDRQELLDRMVAAEPDDENPFTSNKARRRRARLILQAREAEQGGDSAKPFDWRTYESTAKERQLAEPELA